MNALALKIQSAIAAYMAIPRMVDKYKANTDDGSRWITIGGTTDGDAKHKGGFPCKISKDGVILAGGPKGLRGKHVSKVGEYFQKRNNTPAAREKKFRAIVNRQAKKWGVEPAEYESIAEEVWSQQKQYHDSRQAAQKRARQLTGLTAADVSRLENQGFDYSSSHAKTRGFDTAARALANEFPELGWSTGYGIGDDKESVDMSAELWSLLREGKSELPGKHTPEYHAEVDKRMEDYLNKPTFNSAEFGEDTSFSPDEWDFPAFEPYSRRNAVQQMKYELAMHLRRKYAKSDDETRWVTIGGAAEDDKKHVGGTPVKIDGQGRIHGGPDALVGKKIGELDKDVAGTKDDRRKDNQPPGRKPESNRESSDVSTVEPKAPGVSATDIPYDLAYNAHRGTSFVPDRRARQRQNDYVNQMNADWEHLSKLAETPEQMEQLKEEFARYQQGYKSKFLDVLSAASRTLSPMITGPARFPVSSNQKRMDTEMRRIDDLMEFRKKAMAAITRKVAPAAGGPILSSDPRAVEALQEQLAQHEKRHEHMKAVNEAHRKFLKDPASLDKTDFPEDVKELVRNYKPAYSWMTTPYPSYALQNNNANMKRIKERIASISAMKASGPKSEQYTGGITVSESPDDARIRIQFPGKPDAATISQLKSSGFRWSPTAGAWQRQLNNAGRYATENVLKKLGHTKTESQPTIEQPQDGQDEPSIPEALPMAAEQSESTDRTDTESPAEGGDFSTKETVPGMQQSLFGGDDLRTGQKSLFNVALPSKKGSRGSGQSAPESSLLEQIEDELAKKSAAFKPLQGQREMMSRRGSAEQAKYQRRRLVTQIDRAIARYSAWDEADHPRGQAGNAGQFASKDSGKISSWTKDGDLHSMSFKTSANKKYSVFLVSSVDPFDMEMDVPQLTFKDDANSYGITGAGNAREVFNKVTEATIDLIKKENLPAMYFSASEPSRKKLYDRLIRRLAVELPDYEAVASTTQAGKRYYVIAKPEAMERLTESAKNQGQEVDRLSTKYGRMITLESLQWKRIPRQHNRLWSTDDNEWLS